MVDGLALDRSARRRGAPPKLGLRGDAHQLASWRSWPSLRVLVGNGAARGWTFVSRVAWGFHSRRTRRRPVPRPDRPTGRRWCPPSVRVAGFQRRRGESVAARRRSRSGATVAQAEGADDEEEHRKDDGEAKRHPRREALEFQLRRGIARGKRLDDRIHKPLVHHPTKRPPQRRRRPPTSERQAPTL